MLNTMQNPVIRPRAASAEAPIFSRLQWEAIRIGIREGEVALARSKPFGLFWLFLGSKARPLADACLEALRAYAELARVLLPRGRAVPTASLEEAGFSPLQIAALKRTVATPAWGL
jgi:hypothetical protein